jgi:phospholipase C
MKKVFTLAACVIFYQVSFSQPVTESSPQKIKVLSWNIYMLPSWIGHQNRLRAKAIAKVLTHSDYDVVVFQEAFCPMARRKIREGLAKEFPYSVGPGNQKFLSLRINSGIWIFSKYPIVSSRSIVFENKKGSDALSRKGALLVELDVKGNRIQVVGTHLQNAGDDRLRQLQCQEVHQKLLLPFTKTGTPQLICGDFNVNKYRSTESYLHMLTSLEANDGELKGERKFSYDRLNNDLKAEPGQDQDLIDYILIRENQSWVPSMQREIVAIKSRWNKDHEDLSDHYSMLAEITFSNNLHLLTQAEVVVP